MKHLQHTSAEGVTPIKATTTHNNLDQVNEKSITVFNRFNRQVPVYKKFDAEPYKETLFHAERVQGHAVGDALVDPHQTMDSHRDPLYRDPGYSHADLNKRNTRTHDRLSKVTRDNQGRPIIKIVESHGAMNGGLYGQSTFNHESLAGKRNS